nr:GntR family transcriptional regulator [Streptococcus thermophilus]
MLIDVSRDLPIPLPAQVATAIRTAITDGELQPGDEVPSTRELAKVAGISRGSVVTAYDQLISEGYLLASQGSPTRVHPDLPAGTPSDAEAPSFRPKVEPSHRTISLKPSSGHAGGVRPAAWRQAWREAAAEPAISIDPAGQPELRRAIAGHLRLARGLTVSENQIVVTGGSREGLLLILLTLVRRHRQLRVGVEDPGHPGLRRVIPTAGHDAVPCAVDEFGVNVRLLPDKLDALLVTPAFQYPLGASMPAARRSELLTWAHESGTALIEDDFNAELRYRLAPQPPLGALTSQGDVFTLGTFSTLLSRNLSAGYVVTPPAFAESVRQTRKVLGMPVSAVTQLAVAHLLQNGHVRRNTKAVRNRLARRRAIIHTDLVPVLEASGAHVNEMAESNGVDLTLSFDSSARRGQFTEKLRSHRIECGRLESLWSSGDGRAEGLIMSFAHLSDHDFDIVLRALAGNPAL